MEDHFLNLVKLAAKCGSSAESLIKAAVGIGAIVFGYKGAMELLKEQPNKQIVKNDLVGAGLLSLVFFGVRGLEHKDDESKSNQKIKERTAAAQAEAEKHKSDCEADAAAYTQKRQADADLYRAKAEVDVWKAEAMKRVRTDEHQPNEEQQKDQEGSEEAFEKNEPLPPVDQDNSFNLDFANNRLFDNIIHRGDVGMFFGPKGIGKSIVSYWIALSVAEGNQIRVWKDVESNPNPVPPTKVLYYDLELTPMDINERFAQYGYEFPENFIRHDKTQISSSQDIIRDLHANVAQAKRGEDLFVVVDNIKKVMEITCAQTVKPFLNDLETIINKAKAKGVELTIMLVNHPTKDFRSGDSLELGDAAGATELRDFLNFVFAIEPTKISRKHKILKVLNNRAEMEPENVAIVKFENEAPYAHPVVLCETDEKTALNITKEKLEAILKGATVNPTSTDMRKKSRTGLTHEDELEIYRLHKEEGYTPERLAKMFGPKCKTGAVSDTSIRNIIARIEKEQQEPLGT